MRNLKQSIKNFLNFVIITISRIGRLDLLYLAHKERGILRSGDFRTTGERIFIETTLAKILDTDKPIIFDVGANTGNYSSYVRHIFPNSMIFSFEPNPTAFKVLESKSKTHSIHTFNVGLSSCNEHSEIYLYEDNDTTERASLYTGGLKELFGFPNPSKRAVELVRLDEFCRQHGIKHIHFLKIDTEGHELEVLKGAGQMLEDGSIKVIQFEFSMNNVISRIFLKDFYDLMPKYSFYRLKKSNLLPLRSYDPVNEIFVIHNIVAIFRPE